jgi:peptide/nickel transport system substrate-binding protein
MKKLFVFLLLTVLMFTIIGSTAAAEHENPLQDKRVRQAIAYAVDMETLVEGLLEGKAVKANSLTPNGDWKVDGLNNYDYNPEKAKELLAEAGWDSDYELDVVYYYGDQLTVDLMTAVQAYLSQVGIKMNFRKLEGDLSAQLWVTPEDPKMGPSEVEWDMAYAGIAALTMHEYYNRFAPGASSNSHTPTDEKLAELIADTNATADIDLQKEAFYDLQEYFNENLFAIPLYYQQVFVYESDRVDRKGIPYGNEQFTYDWRIIDWDVEANDEGERVLYSNSGPVEFFETTFVNPGAYMPQKFLFDRLIVADKNLTPKKGQLASEYTVSEDGMEIEFVLRDGIKWHDGEPITAEDVRFTVEYSAKVPQLNAVASKTYSSLKGYQEYIDGEADHISGIKIDGNTINFEFAELDPNALLTFSQWPPLPKHLLEDSDPIQAQRAEYWQAPVGSGPFRIEEVSMNDYATFVPFADYWDEGAGNIEKIQLYPSGESDPSIVLNAESGRVDYAYSKSVTDAKSVEKMDFMEVHPVDIRYTRLFYVNKFPHAEN